MYGTVSVMIYCNIIFIDFNFLFLFIHNIDTQLLPNVNMPFNNQSKSSGEFPIAPGTNNSTKPEFSQTNYNNNIPCQNSFQQPQAHSIQNNNSFNPFNSNPFHRSASNSDSNMSLSYSVNNFQNISQCGTPNLNQQQNLPIMNQSNSNSNLYSLFSSSNNTHNSFQSCINFLFHLSN